MVAMEAVHIRCQELASFLKGRLDDDSATRVAHHVLSCTKCRRELKLLMHLLWPSMSLWIKGWLVILSFTWLPRRASTRLRMAAAAERNGINQSVAVPTSE